MNAVLKSFNKAKGYPFGKRLFSMMVARQARYFTTIKPIIEDIQPGFSQVFMPKRKAILNHIGTVHAIALCNICELAMGMAVESCIPSHRRWIPMGMQVNYLKKATTDMTATCQMANTNWEESEVPCFISVKNTDGVEVMTATITLKVTDKPRK